jgi:hypothetical protein
MRLREQFGPFDNPEGCDFETTLEHLQPWLDRKAPALQHAHAFHMRYYGDRNTLKIGVLVITPKSK